MRSEEIKMKMGSRAKHIIIYGLTMAALIFGLKWLQWNFLIVDNSIELFIGVIAIGFTLLGFWIAKQIMSPKSRRKEETFTSEMTPSKDFVVNQYELNKLKLTKREYEILELLVQGYRNAEIAKALYLSISTIKTHVSNLYSKLEVKSRYQAITKAKRMEIVK